MGGRNIQLPLRAGKPAGTEEDPAGRRQHADRRRLEEDELLNGGKKTQPKKTSPFRPAELRHFQNAADIIDINVIATNSHCDTPEQVIEGQFR